MKNHAEKIIDTLANMEEFYPDDPEKDLERAKDVVEKYLRDNFIAIDKIKTIEQEAKVSLDDMSKCVARELKLRINVYPRWVINSKMTTDESCQEISRMRGVSVMIGLLRDEMYRDGRQLDLFDRPKIRTGSEDL